MYLHRLSPLDMILGNKPCVQINIEMKYPTEDELDHNFTEKEKVKNIGLIFNSYCDYYNYRVFQVFA